MSLRSLGVLLVALLLSVPAASAQEVSSGHTDALRFRPIGPTGGRTTAVDGEPGDPNVLYAGAANGGVWRTLDGGVSWEPTMDDQPVNSIGEVEVSPAAHNEVWAGTGETWYIRAYTGMGNGVYKSTDRGGSWRHMGLENTGRIAAIAAHPQDPDVVYVCALGDAYGPQPERGVFETTDGGETWEKILFVNEDTGCSDLAIDASDPETLFAGMWPVHITGWDLNSGGGEGGVYVTHDGGESWERRGGGIPTDSVGKVSVDVARSDPSRVYALIEKDDPHLYRSDDGGDTWELVNHSHAMTQRAPYYTRMRVAPDDRDRLYFLNTSLSMSKDGGEHVIRGEPYPADDAHDMWMDPADPDRLTVAYDHGVLTSPNGGKTWDVAKLPLAQMYHVAVDDRRPYNVYSNRQDGPAYMGPSRTLRGGFFAGGGPTEGDWRYIAGCESGFAVPDTAADRVWSGCYNGQLGFTDLETMQKKTVDVWPVSAIGWEPKDVRERFYWVFPIAVSPHTAGEVMVGSQRVHRTTDAAQSWNVISPDLTRDLESHQESSSGFTTDNIVTFSGSSLYALAESPVREGVLWAGSNDGLLHVSRDDGGTWTDVTENIPEIPQFAWISNVEPSHFDPGTAYISVDDHMQGNFIPYIYRTTDYGQSWERIDGDLPRCEVCNVHVVREDPERQGLLYAGTEKAVYFSLDDGDHWNRLTGARGGHTDDRLPPAPAYWLTVQREFDDLVLATFGRGIWILDDIGPLRQMDREALASDVLLFEPRDPYRFQPVAGRLSAVGTQMETANPREGVPISYWLGSGADSAPTLEILNGEGEVIRTMEGTAEAGLNRVWWDLRHEGRKTVTLWTPPPEARWKEVPNEGLPSQQWGGSYDQGPEVVPGEYTVRLTAGGEEQSRTFRVQKDPRSEGTIEDIEANVALQLELLEETNRVIDAVNRLEWTRRQLTDLLEASERVGQDGALADSVRSVREQAIEVENAFMDVHRPGGLEEFASPMKLYGRYIHLMSRLNGDADFPPTGAEREAHRFLRKRLEEAEAEMETLYGQAIPALNEVLRAEGRPALTAAPPDGS